MQIKWSVTKGMDTDQQNRLKSARVPDSRTVMICIPGGRIKIDTDLVPKESHILQNNSEVQLGGYWRPKDCYGRDRVAIVIPFRDRQTHLNILLKYLHPLLQRQQIKYRIFVVEQVRNFCDFFLHMESFQITNDFSRVCRSVCLPVC